MWRSLGKTGSLTTKNILKQQHQKLPLLVFVQTSSNNFNQTIKFFSNESHFSKQLSSSDDEQPQFSDNSFTESPHVERDEDTVESESQLHQIDSDFLSKLVGILQTRDIGGVSFDSLDQIPVHQDFVIAALQSPQASGDNLVKFYNWVSRKPGFSHTGSAIAQLVSGFVNNGFVSKKSAYALWDLVKEIGEKGDVGVVNVDLLNGVLGVLGKLGKGKAVLEVFDKFGDFGCVPNSDSFYLTIDALGRRSFFDWVGLVSDKMVEARCLPSSGEKVGKVISWLSKGGKGEKAHSVYVLTKELKLVPPQSAVEFMIRALCRDDATVGLAVSVLDDFEGKSREYAVKPFSSVIRGLCRIKDVDGAKKLILKMVKEGPPPGNAVFNSVISAYAKAGDMGEAIALVKLMESRGLKPDVYTYTVIISGYVNGGQMEEASKIFSEAKKKHSKLSPVTYHTLIRGYCKLEEFDKAKKLFSEMKRFGVQPTADEYNKLIQSLCLKALDWESAEKLLAEMKNKGLYLNGITRGLVRAVKELEQEEIQNPKASLEA